MRATWDAAASSDAVDSYVGDPATAAAELDGFFGRLDADPRGGVCVEVGCGPGRMTRLLAGRFDRVIAVDVSPEMLERARRAVPDENVDFRAVERRAARLRRGRTSATRSSATSSSSTSRTAVS